eukprot:CAMPEP_0197733670 /NCGR_PEP_ID=MMETSP1434-20131217/44022_1 /TAXON_ID=265543 /ORGANISM="Minutocellus polymorphus, Strain CCMP3303" /LENGTH=149 /DNA_ID=CAMNT_0043321055 /DNA_START=34 /DNA_END=483 /DNA_ORIENTATION=-
MARLLSSQMATYPVALIGTLLLLGSASARNVANAPTNSAPMPSRRRPRPLPATFIDPSPLAIRTVPPFLKPSASDIAAAASPEGDNEGESVKVGSSEYYKGFVSRKIDEEPEERITGDAVLGPTLKLAGQVTVVLALLTIGFLASNGII